MNAVERLDHGAERHQSIVMDSLRVVLGCILVIKGIEFGRNPQDLYLLIQGTPFDFLGLFVAHYIAMVHLAGGVLIAAGLITRWAVAFQLPIVLCAVLFVRTGGMFSFYSSQIQAAGVLILLIVFLVYGSGRWSADNYMKRYGNG